jgi:hypothetical protein
MGQADVADLQASAEQHLCASLARLGRQLGE